MWQIIFSSVCQIIPKRFRHSEVADILLLGIYESRDRGPGKQKMTCNGVEHYDDISNYKIVNRYVYPRDTQDILDVSIRRPYGWIQKCSDRYSK